MFITYVLHCPQPQATRRCYQETTVLCLVFDVILRRETRRWSSTERGKPCPQFWYWSAFPQRAIGDVTRQTCLFFPPIRSLRASTSTNSKTEGTFSLFLSTRVIVCTRCTKFSGPKYGDRIRCSPRQRGGLASVTTTTQLSSQNRLDKHIVLSLPLQTPLCAYGTEIAALCDRVQGELWYVRRIQNMSVDTDNHGS